MAFSGPVFAQGKPDFTGTWTLDTAKSDMRTGQERRASGKVTLEIKQTPTALTTTRKAGNHDETSTEKLGGGESIKISPSGQVIRSTSRWEGPTLITKSSMSSGQGTVELTFVRSLSADGKVMTIETILKAPNGVSKNKLIYNKQK